MFQRIGAGWELFKRSFSILMANRRLLLFPVVNMIAIAGIVLFFAASFVMQPTGHSYKSSEHWKKVFNSAFTEDSIQRYETAKAAGASNELAKHELQMSSAGIKFFAIVYFASMFLATFFNVAFYHEIVDALNGRPVNIRDGFSFALSRLPAILWWSLFAGAVGYLIGQLEQRFGLIGKIVIRLIGLAWSVASVFAIPVLVCRDSSNPVDVLKESAATIKKTWGEALGGYAGFHGIGLLVVFGAMVPAAAIAVPGFMISSGALIAIGFLVWIALVFAFGYVSSVAGSVFQCALYQFATTGRAPTGYTPELMQSAWKKK